MKVRIRKCRDNLFVVLPKQAAADLDWGSGDIIDIEVVDGHLAAVRVMTKYDRAIELAEKAMGKYRETFEVLAKT